jgi:acyl-CoA hydrolase
MMRAERAAGSTHEGIALMTDTPTVESAYEARLVEIVFPNDTNPYGTMFGGAAYALMDRAAFLAANGYSHCNAVTASSEHLDFRVPIRQGEIVEVIARVVHTGRTSMIVRVDLNARAPLDKAWRRCTSGFFTMVAVDDEGRPQAVPAFAPRSERDRADWEWAERIRATARERRDTEAAGR